MSLFGAMNTAISGLAAQSTAFGNISDNVANSQTTGFKRTDTAFIDYLTSSSAAANNPGAVVARPDYMNTVQGTLAQSDNPLALAITGQGFFSVSQPIGGLAGATQFSPQTYYSRAGDFAMNKDGYLVNSAGGFLNGWDVDPTTGIVDRTSVAPIQVTQTVYNPVASTEVSIAANLPATPAAGTPVSAQIDVYDSLGTPHTVTLDWTQTAANDWNVAINVPDDITAAARGTAEVQFGPIASGNPVADGTVGAVGAATGSVTTSAYAAGAPATLGFTADFGNGPQAISLHLGDFGLSSGVTQYAGSTFALGGITQNGVPPGSFSSVTTTATGDIQVNYDNGQSRVIARVPITTFNNPDALQRQNGQAFTATLGSGDPVAKDAGSSGAGGLVTSSIEQSNVDIASEFSKLIIAQRAYTANTKMVTTADDMLQNTLDMKR
ncbi:MAG TPA: flagellar hook protein FlgE [Acetobacteraceae bacterium]|nr:flagellar hook protein FlgE [Acetobacteraceae bacterium]